jgi:hypothetical protein
VLYEFKFTSTHLIQIIITKVIFFSLAFYKSVINCMERPLTPFSAYVNPVPRDILTRMI